jgi:hypothetical protein
MGWVACFFCLLSRPRAALLQIIEQASIIIKIFLANNFLLKTFREREGGGAAVFWASRFNLTLGMNLL